MFLYNSLDAERRISIKKKWTSPPSNDDLITPITPRYWKSSVDLQGCPSHVTTFSSIWMLFMNNTYKTNPSCYCTTRRTLDRSQWSTFNNRLRLCRNMRNKPKLSWYAVRSFSLQPLQRSVSCWTDFLSWKNQSVRSRCLYIGSLRTITWKRESYWKIWKTSLHNEFLTRIYEKKNRAL